MINLHLNDLDVFKILCERASNRSNTARVFSGLLVGMAGDAQELLEYVRNTHPSFTSHNLQHSWRALKRIEAVLSPEALADLSDLEIFSLVTAAAFHDAGMAPPGATRQDHAARSDEFIRSYFDKRLDFLSEYGARLARCIGFIAYSHGMTWQEMVVSEFFTRRERIAEETLRTGVLCILLRLGDLLDLDSDRSPDVLTQCMEGYFSEEDAQLHSQRHDHVIHFDLSPAKIAITVESHSKEEHYILSRGASN